MRNKTVQVISPHSWESTERSCFSQSVAIMGERSLGDDRPNGLSQFLAVIFVMGAVAGIGVLALPHAMTQTGWTGAAVIVMCALVSGYCGSRLGTCWTILEERWLEYKGSSRNPYPTIAYRACGPWMRTATSVIQLVGLFGYGAVFVLLAGELVMDVTRQLSHDAVHLSFCYWLMLIAIPLAVLMWLGSPKDFGFAALGALGATLLATCIVVGVCGTRMTSGKGLGTMQGKITVGGFFRGFGTIMFSYGGAAMFPTIQNDMKSRRKFPTAVIYASIVLVVLYLVMSVMGYLTFGSTVRPNILLSIGDGAISIIVQFLFIAHLLCAFLIVINPMCQEFEEHLSLPIGECGSCGSAAVCLIANAWRAVVTLVLTCGHVHARVLSQGGAHDSACLNAIAYRPM